LNNLGKEDIASKVSMAVTSIFHKQNVITHLFWKNGYDISVESVSDNQAKNKSVTNANGNSTETAIPLQTDSKADQTASEGMETPTTTPSSDKEPRMSKRKKKPPTTNSEDFLW
jgi:hypothetical protein